MPNPTATADPVLALPTVHGRIRAVRSISRLPDAAFAAGESRHVSEIRRHLRRRGLTADRMLMTGSWQRGS